MALCDLLKVEQKIELIQSKRYSYKQDSDLRWRSKVKYITSPVPKMTCKVSFLDKNLLDFTDIHNRIKNTSVAYKIIKKGRFRKSARRYYYSRNPSLSRIPLRVNFESRPEFGWLQS